MSFVDRLSKYTPRKVTPLPGDIYVAPYGSDDNDGSFDRPFNSPWRASRAVREAKAAGRKGTIAVCFRAGEYITDGLHLTEEDSGTDDLRVVYRAYGDGEVILNGGISIPASDFQPVPDEIRDRLHDEAKDKVVQVNLTQYGLTPEDWGPLCPIGKFGTEDKYDSYVPGTNCELFCNGSRMTLARYPNAGTFMKLDAVADVGDCWEFPEQNYFLEWKERRNHRGGKYMVNKPTVARLRTWQSYDNVWVYGYFYHDWADSSSPVAEWDLNHRSFSPEYVSRFGARKGGNYYFYNVLDELDAPGEWYLNRENGTLYIYPPVDLSENPRIEMTITRNSVIHAENVNNTVFEHMTIKGTRADAVVIQGNDNVVRNLKISGVLGHAVVVNGYRNLVTECDISHMGKGGIRLIGGDRETLTPGLNVADNNLIHDWSEVYFTYCGGVHIEGVGNTCSHNEMYNAPHTAIFYYGNDHTIEYNYIHHVVLLSSDAGAIYTGQDWTGYGSVVRYNVLHDIGGENFYPDALYFDDMASGQTAYGNLVINAKKNGVLIGGGRDNHVFNNIFINNKRSIGYDDRGRDGFLNNGWAIRAVIDYETGGMWQRLRAVPYQSEVWAAKYPRLAALSHDFNDPHNPNFGPNPAFSHIHDNLVVAAEGPGCRFFGDVPKYSLIERNCVYTTVEHAGIEMDEYVLTPGCQALKDMPDFPNIPFEMIGRY